MIMETIPTALTTAETGHLVLGTVRTPDATQTSERIVGVFPPYQHSRLGFSFRRFYRELFLRISPQSFRKRPYLVPEIMVATSGVRNLIRERAVDSCDRPCKPGAI